jgi:hypothetical protein
MVQRKGGILNSGSKRHRIMHERSSDDDDITEMLVYVDGEINSF